MLDALVIGAGPAGLALTAALCRSGLCVGNLSVALHTAPWPNTYGIWEDELAPLGLTHLLEHRWHNSVVYTHDRAIPLDRTYGLFSNTRLQAHLLQQSDQITWHSGAAAKVDHSAHGSTLTTRDGTTLHARVIIDASGHAAALVQRPAAASVAYQTAYGIVGTFDQPPVQPGQIVLQDWRSDHLPPADRAGPPTFLYAMDLGNDRYFVEETSLAHAPALSFDLLKQRLHARLAAINVTARDVQHTERCIFPMNQPLPYLDQPVLGFGGAASMVHPASGYLVGAALRRAPVLAQSIAASVRDPQASPVQIAAAGWGALWPSDRIRRRNLYLFGLSCLLQMDSARLNAFFGTFFDLPRAQWTGYLGDALATRQLSATMLRVFLHAPQSVRAVLAGGMGREPGLMWRALTGAAP